MAKTIMKKFPHNLNIGDTIEYEINYNGNFNGKTQRFKLTKELLNHILKWEDEYNYHRMKIVG